MDGTPDGVSATALSSLAIVKVNWDQGSQSYSDSFVPFVVTVVGRAREPIDAQTARDLVKAQFGLQIPDAVVASLMHRAVRQGLLSKQPQRRFSCNESGNVMVAAFEERIVILARRRKGLVVALEREIRNAELEASSEDTESTLLQFIEVHSVPLLSRLLRGDSPSILTHQREGLEYVVAQFVVRVIEESPELADYLSDVVKGSMLSASLYAVGNGEVERKFRSTTLFLDTPLLLKVLGHEGELAGRPVRELVDMAYESGARVACFEHSLQEARGVLHGVAEVLRGGSRPPAIRGVLANYLQLRGSASDVLEKVGSIETDLRRLRVEVFTRPEHETALTVDESALLDQLGEAIRYSNQSALTHDVDSLTSIHRLRRGRRVEQIERSGALLVTDNMALVHTAQRFFGAHEGASVGPAILDHNVATLLWAKRPHVAPDLPVRQILADSLALLDPGPSMWRSYMDQIDDLRKRSEISANDVTELRFSIESHRALMEKTRGEPRRVSATTVRAALDASRAALAKPERDARARAEEAAQAERQRAETERGRAEGLAETLDSSNADIAKLEQAVAAMTERDEQRKTQIGARGRAEARLLVKAVLISLTALGVASVMLPNWVELDGFAGGLVRWGGIVLGVLSVSTLVFGGSVGAFIRKLEDPIAAWRTRSLAGKAFVDIGGDAS